MLPPRRCLGPDVFDDPVHVPPARTLRLRKDIAYNRAKLCLGHKPPTHPCGATCTCGECFCAACTLGTGRFKEAVSVSPSAESRILTICAAVCPQQRVYGGKHDNAMRERDIQQICQDTINSKFAGGMARWNAEMRGEAEKETLEESTRAGLMLPAIRTAVLMSPDAVAWLSRVKQAVVLRKQALEAVALVQCEEGQGLNDGSFLDCCALVVPGISTDDLDSLFMNCEHSPSFHSAFVALLKSSATLIQSLVRGVLARCLIRMSFKHMQADQVFNLLMLSITFSPCLSLHVRLFL